MAVKTPETNPSSPASTGTESGHDLLAFMVDERLFAAVLYQAGHVDTRRLTVTITGSRMKYLPPGRETEIISPQFVKTGAYEDFKEAVEIRFPDGDAHNVRVTLRVEPGRQADNSRIADTGVSFGPEVVRD